MKKITLLLIFFISVFLSANNEIIAQTTSASLGSGTSSSATRGPFQRSDTLSSSVFSRSNIVYTQAEVLTTLGISAGSTISQINWDLGSTNTITATGDATMKIYMKNSSVTSADNATGTLWNDIISNSTLVGTYTFNTSNNFPGVKGFLDFPLDTDFNYTGESIEISVEWDCSGLTSIHANPNRLFSGKGSLNWNWDNTTHDALIYRAGSSSPPSDLQLSRLRSQRVNTQFVYTLPPSCAAPSNLAATNLTATSADLSWDAVSGASAYNWKVVAAGAGSGGTAVASGSTAGTMATATGLSSGAYDLHVQADCGGGTLSAFSTASNFVIGGTTSASLGSGTSSSSGRGPFQRSDTLSSSVFSRSNMVYTQAEVLTTLGITAGSTISQINWDLGSTNTITAAGDATMKIYMKNSSVTSADNATGTLWNDIISNSTLVGTYTFNTSNNFPGAKGFLDFPLDTNFDYTGESIEISVEWDCSGLTSIHDNPNRLFSGNGSLNWNWDDTAHDALIYRAGSSSAPSDLQLNRLRAERVNTQFVYNLPPPPSECDGVILSADASMNTYDLINTVLGGSTTTEAIEVPDCGHAAFGDHITQVNDPDLGKDVFVFHMHVDEDDDRCINFDRQRNEIKTYGPSPDNLLGVLGETVQYKWKFKLDAGFQPSSKFTHIHQLKSVGASNNEDAMPQITFTTRKGTPDKLELRYAETLTQITWAETDLTPFKGEWVEVTETVTYGDWGDGVYSVDINKVSDGSSLLSYTNNSTRMWKTDASFVRPKWGIYRSLEDAVDLRDEQVSFADFCIDEISTASSCAATTTFLDATNITFSTADLSWGGVAGATTYNWKVVPAGEGSGGTAIASGISSKTTVTATGLASTTSYDLHVEAVCGTASTTGFSEAHNFMTTEVTTAVTTDPIGTGTSSSSSRGPIHQGGSTSSSTRYSRYFQLFTESELEAVGLGENDEITELQWYITTSDVITDLGDAPFKIYIKNSTATQATEGTWTALTTGSTLALDAILNVSNNFPGSEGWMPFTLDAPFVYTGGALEVAVEWDWASVAFTNGGSIKWRYTDYGATADPVMVRALGTSGYSTNLTESTTSRQRANMQIVYEPAIATCPAPSNLSATNITTSSADISWDAVDGASNYTWKVVVAGDGDDGVAVAEGTGAGTSASVTDLTCLTAYDLHVQADCGGDIGLFSAAYNFVTLSAVPSSMLTIGTGTSSSSSRGPIQQGGGTSSTRYSRFNQVFTQAELAAAGLTANSSITELQWSLNSTDIIVGSGDAPFRVYIKNSSATEATVIGWSTLIADATMVVERIFNTTNNFPGVTGWMPFTFNAPFLYTGGALEIAVEWDYGSISIPAFTGSDASNPNGGSIKWHYSTFPDTVVVRGLGSGSHATSNLSFSTSSSLPTQRANIQMVFVPETSCEDPMEECPETRQVDETDIANETYRANTITSKGTVENSSIVILAATTSVTLEVGFHAKAGADFTAKIEECISSAFQEEEVPEAIARFSPTNTTQTDTRLDIKVYPNPINQQLNVELQAFEKGQVRLFDGTGKTHITRIITGRTTLDTNNLPLGIYFLQVLDENSGQFFTRKIVKQ